jgi:hypothetical protein
LLPEGEQIRPVRSGLLRGLHYPIDFTRQTQVYLGLYERETYSYIKRLTRDILTFFDVGAADGLMTIYALARTDAEQVISFEPQKALHANIRIALKANSLGQVEALRLLPHFVGAHDDENTCRLDSFKGQVAYPCFLKIDVDGPEAEVIKGAEGLLKDGDCRLLVETHSLANESDCIKLLQSMGFRVNIVPNAWWRMFFPERRIIEHNRWLVAHL